jgi:hypothetical protein
VGHEGLEAATERGVLWPAAAGDLADAVRIQIEQSRARKRWGHGRLKQLVKYALCRVRGHDFGSWIFDWPYDFPEHWQEVGEPVRDPRDNEPLTWTRGCKECRTVEIANNVKLCDAGYLPGAVTGLFANPIRQEFYE